jgi:hypothetical protein
MRIICGTLFSREEIFAAADEWDCSEDEAWRRLMAGEMADSVLEVLAVANIHRGDSEKVH